MPYIPIFFDKSYVIFRVYLANIEYDEPKLSIFDITSFSIPRNVIGFISGIDITVDKMPNCRYSDL